MTKRIKTSEALELMKEGTSVGGFVLSDVETQQLGFRDALLLAENGFVVPSGNIVYDDADIEYDADFDEVEWRGEPTNLQDFLVSKGITHQAETDTAISIEIAVEDQAVRHWLEKNSPKLKRIVEKLVIDLYHTDQILHAK